MPRRQLEEWRSYPLDKGAVQKLLAELKIPLMGLAEAHPPRWPKSLDLTPEDLESMWAAGRISGTFCEDLCVALGKALGRCISPAMIATTTRHRTLMRSIDIGAWKALMGSVPPSDLYAPRLREDYLLGVPLGES